MTLYINTASQEETIIAILKNDVRVAFKKFKFARKQAEKLLPAIDKLLKTNDLKLVDVKKIKVAAYGGSFTSLRIGVVTANALGYALKIPVVSEENPNESKKFSKYSLVTPIYNSEPNIGKSKKNGF